MPFHSLNNIINNIVLPKITCMFEYIVISILNTSIMLNAFWNNPFGEITRSHKQWVKGETTMTLFVLTLTVMIFSQYFIYNCCIWPFLSWHHVESHHDFNVCYQGNTIYIILRERFFYIIKLNCEKNKWCLLCLMLTVY